MSSVNNFRKFASHFANCPFLHDHTKRCNCGYDQVVKKLKEQEQLLDNKYNCLCKICNTVFIGLLPDEDVCGACRAKPEQPILPQREFDSFKRTIDKIIKHRTRAQLNPHRVLKLIRAYEELPKNIAIKKDGLYYLSVKTKPDKKGKTKHAHLCLENILNERGPLVTEIFLQWAKEQTECPIKE